MQTNLNQHTNTEHKTRIVIVGGGSAGWMTAAALSGQLPSADYHITLIESPQIGTVSVGEATIPGILEFNQLLGIDETEFLRFTKGSFKLGIMFRDWYKPNHEYMHPFGPYGVDLQGIPFHHYWLKQQQAASSDVNANCLSQYCIEYQSALANKFSHPQAQSRSPLAHMKYAYHFDATLYAEFLRQLAVGKGVLHIQDNISDVSKHNNGDIAAVHLEQYPEVKGDLFIDCSGFKGLLINQHLGVKYEDWRKYLPCDSAIAQPSESLDHIKPYTIATAHDNGWQWQIPLQHRIGNGYVYSSEFLDQASAEDQLTAKLPSKAIAEPRALTWINGKRKQVWERNCIAIGLSAGFIEPLESTGLHLIQSTIVRLLSMFPTFPIQAQVRKQFNDYSNEEIDRIRDFVVLHYVATERIATDRIATDRIATDQSKANKAKNNQDNASASDFWQYCAQIELPEHLQNKIKLYQSSGQVFRDNNELFNEISWFTVMNGQGIKAEQYHPLVNNMPDIKRQQIFKTIAGAMQESTQSMLSHQDYLARYLA